MSRSQEERSKENKKKRRRKKPSRPQQEQGKSVEGSRIRRKTIVIESDWGTQHKYEIFQWNASKTFDLAPELLNIISRVSGEILEIVSDNSDDLQKSARRAAEREGVDLDSMDMEERFGAIKDAMQDMDTISDIDVTAEQVDTALSDFASTLLEHGGSELVKEMFEDTERAADPNGNYEQLQNVSKHFDHIYQGNLGEAFRALKEVLWFNYFPTLSGNSKGQSSR